MLYLAAMHVLITCCCFIAGFLFYEQVLRISRQAVIIYLVSGLILLTALTQIIALFIPINIVVQMVVALLLLLGVGIFKKSRLEILDIIRRVTSNVNWMAVVALLACWLLILILNAGPTIMDDTDSYHIQMIKWLKEYGTVPGLVHVHERYGFNSSWFSAIALFSIDDGSRNYFVALNGALSLWFCYYLIAVIRRGGAPGLAAVAVFIISLAAWPLIRGNVSSANYDFITTTLIVILFFESMNEKKEQHYIECIIWPAFLITIRLTNFMLAILVVFAIYHLWRLGAKRKIGLTVLISGIIVVPFFIRNVLLSGYLFYPSLAFDVFQVDWKADPALTNEILHFIKYFNRVNTGFLPLAETEKMGGGSWISSWFRYMSNPDKMVLIPGLIGIILTPFIKTKTLVARWFHFMLIPLVIVWFLVAPDPRFIYGPLLCGIAFFVLAATRLIPFNSTPPQLLLAFISLSVAGFLVVKLRTAPQFSLITPYELPIPPTTVKYIGKIPVNIAHKLPSNWNARCYNIDLPCGYRIDPRVESRGSSIQNGFRLKKNYQSMPPMHWE